jgi:hypothetical protein
MAAVRPLLYGLACKVGWSAYIQECEWRLRALSFSQRRTSVWRRCTAG